MVTGTARQKSATKISLSKLIDLLNECLSREYDAIIRYGIYSQVANRADRWNLAQRAAAPNGPGSCLGQGSD
jgi:hypothetical protein